MTLVEIRGNANADIDLSDGGASFTLWREC